MITVDTNVLVRAAVQDDPSQGQVAARVLMDAESVALTVPTLCEFVWVLRRAYKKTPAETAQATRTLVEAAGVVTDRPAVEAGLDMLDRGGDFADGVIAYQGAYLGADRFVSFDKEAVRLLTEGGVVATLLGS